jgi:hypothetical protein
LFGELVALIETAFSENAPVLSVTLLVPFTLSLTEAAAIGFPFLSITRPVIV